MSRYDGLIIPRSYSEYLNKTDSATLSQMLQHLTGLWSHAVAAGDNKPVTSDAVYGALTDAATIQQALQLPGVLSGAVAAGDNKAVTSNAVNGALANYTVCSTELTQDANNAFSLAPSNNGKTTYYLCNDHTPSNGFWWNIEAICSNVYGEDFIFQRALQCGGNSEIYIRQSNDRGNSWNNWKKITTV